MAAPVKNPRLGTSLSIYGDVFGTRRGSRSAGFIASEKGKDTLVDVLDAVQSVVDALTDPEGGRYVAALSDNTTGQTSLGKRVIKISHKPLTDTSLNLAQVTEVMTGLSCHEIGHTICTPMLEKVLKERFNGDPLAKYIGNVLDDVRLEDYMTREYPGIGASFRPLAEWMARDVRDRNVPMKFHAGLDLTGRTNFMVRSIRFAFAFRWVGNALTRRERAYWQDLAARYSAEAWDEDTIERLLREGMARLQAPDFSEEPEQQKPPEVDQPSDDDESESEPSDEQGEGEGEGGSESGEGNGAGKTPGDAPTGEGNESESESGDDEIEEAEESVLDQIGADSGEPDDDDDDLDEDDDVEIDSEDDDESDEEPWDDHEADEQDAREGRTPLGDLKDGTNESETDSDDPEGNEITDPNGSGDGDARGDGADASVGNEENEYDPDAVSDGSLDYGARGGNGNVPTKAENNLDSGRLDRSVDDLVDENPYMGARLQQTLDEERAVEKIKSRDGFGTMRVRVNL